MLLSGQGGWLKGGEVSILTRPEGRVLPFLGARLSDALTVSILTRPEGRVLLLIGMTSFAGASVSILTRPEGRVLHDGYLHCLLHS